MGKESECQFLSNRDKGKSRKKIQQLLSKICFTLCLNIQFFYSSCDPKRNMINRLISRLQEINKLIFFIVLNTGDKNKLQF